MYKTGTSMGSHQSGDNPASGIKSKLMSLETVVQAIQDDLQEHVKEMGKLKNEETTLQVILDKSMGEVKNSIEGEINHIEGNMKQHFVDLKAENLRLQHLILSMKGDKVALQQQIIGLQRRVAELEMHLGRDSG